jgi:hypothetical protein
MTDHSETRSCCLACPQCTPLEDATRDVPPFSLAGEEFAAKVVDVYDADTMHIVVRYGGRLVRFSCCLYGVQTPPMCPRSRHYPERADRTRVRGLALVARDYMRALVAERGPVFRMRVQREGTGFDAWGRLLVTLHYRSDDSGDSADGTLNAHLLSTEHALPYVDGPRHVW